MEFVYVVKRYDLFDLEFPHGFHQGTSGDSLGIYLERIKNRGFFVERRFCETDSGFKQIIPYSIIVNNSRILLIQRTSDQGESRLHNKYSIGVGGHINPVDEDENNILKRGCIREIEEEINIEEAYDPIPIGIINDESNPVGSVHFGIVYVVYLKTENLQVRETSMMTAEFIEFRDLKQRILEEDSNFETWSSLIIHSLDSIPK
jgi:predicted NUDIX family phosphoesterase